MLGEILAEIVDRSRHRCPPAARNSVLPSGAARATDAAAACRPRRAGLHHELLAQSGGQPLGNQAAGQIDIAAGREAVRDGDGGLRAAPIGPPDWASASATPRVDNPVADNRARAARRVMVFDMPPPPLSGGRTGDVIVASRMIRAPDSFSSLVRRRSGRASSTESLPFCFRITPPMMTVSTLPAPAISTDGIYRVIDRRHVHVVGAQHDDVGLLAGCKRADLTVQPKRPLAPFDRRPLQRLARGAPGMVFRGELPRMTLLRHLLAAGKQQRRLHLAEHLARSVELDIDADRRQTALLPIAATMVSPM